MNEIELNKLGISLKDINGNYRNLEELLKDLNKKYKENNGQVLKWRDKNGKLYKFNCRCKNNSYSIKLK